MKSDLSHWLSQLTREFGVAWTKNMPPGQRNHRELKNGRLYILF